MKKYTILLLASSLLSLGTTQAATQNITKCYGQSVTLKATQTGNSYQWYKDGTAISGETQNEYKVTNLEESAKYECKITTNGGSRTTNFLKSTNGKDYGDFEFPASQATNWDQYKESFEVDDQIRNEKYYARIELKKFMQDGVCDAGESTTTKNPNLIKPAWFNSTSAYQNNYMLAVDGPQANAGAFEFFEVYDLKLKAGQEYEFSCYIVNIDAKYTQAGRSLPQLQFKLVQGGNVLHSGNLFTIKPDLNKWDKYYVTYTPSQDIEYVKLIISNQTQGQDGNDFAIDAVYFGAKQNTASTSVTDVFNVTVYDTFTYEFKTDEVCPGEQATITTTLKPAHGGTLEPTSNYKYEWKVNGTAPVVSTQKDLVVTAPNTVGTLSYVLSTSSTVCYSSAANSETTSVKTKDCGIEKPISHPEQEACPGVQVELKCNTSITGAQSVKWDHDSSSGQSVKVNAGPNVGDKKDFKCTIVQIENGNTVTYIETFTVKTKDCTTEKTETHNLSDCPKQEVTLTCTTTADATKDAIVWSHDATLKSTTAKVKTKDTPAAEGTPNTPDTYTCTITKVNDKGETFIYTETFTVKTIDCTTEETETHNLSDCPKQEVTLTCTTTADATKDAIVWSHDATLKSTTAKVKTKDTPAAEGTPNTPDTYTCTITKVNDKGETFIYTETFNVTTKNDCVGENKEKEELTIGSSVTIQSDYWNITGAIFEWYKVVDGVNTPVPGDADNPGKLTFKANESITYFCITTLPNGYVYTETRVIEVHNDTEKDVYICYNDDFSVTATTKDASEYKWYDTTNDTKVLSEIETLEIKELKQNTSYICRIIGADKITKITETYHVKVNPLPEFNVEVKVANVTVDITNGSAPYELSLSNGTTSTATSNEYTYEDLVEDTYTLSITDKNKCVYANEFTISIPKLEPMKFFSPNNDNLNDLWLVHGIETAPNAYIRIYDRHSKLLYQCKGSEFQGWDGKYETKDMVQDDYWYVISVPETEETLSGHFTLKR